MRGLQVRWINHLIVRCIIGNEHNENFAQLGTILIH